MIYEKIKQLRLEARKNRDTPLIEAYTYLQGELERGEKNPSDEKSLKVLKSLSTALKDSGDTVTLGIVAQLLEDFTPQQLTEEDITNILNSMIRVEVTPKLGEIQKHFKDNYPGQYDGAVVTRIYKELVKETQ